MIAIANFTNYQWAVSIVKRNNIDFVHGHARLGYTGGGIYIGTLYSCGYVTLKEQGYLETFSRQINSRSHKCFTRTSSVSRQVNLFMCAVLQLS